MRTVITISLNGNAYQIDAVGFDALRAYLQVAEQRLAGNPDQEEILADLEQAVADKCNRYLGPHKNVVSAGEITEVLREMGPVDGGAAEGQAQPGARGQQSTAGAGDFGAESYANGTPGGESGAASGSDGQGAAASATSNTGPNPLRRLYLIREGAAIAGVCKGLAAYLNIDVSIVRILFIVLTIITGGMWILVYLVMMFVIPYAQTSEQHAAAHGWPFNAEELIARAKAHYAEFKNSTRWERQKWRAQQRMWKSQKKQWERQQRDWERYGSAQGSPPPPPPWTGGQPPPPPNMSYTNQVLSGVFGPLADLVGVLLFVLFLLALFSIVTHHRFFGWPLPIDVPNWVGIVFLIVLYQAVVAPLRRARHSAYYGSPFANGWWAVLGALVWIMLVMAFAWQLWLHWDQVTDFFQGFAGTLRDVIVPWHEIVERKAGASPIPVNTGLDWLPALPVALLPLCLAVAVSA
jgi:phage shock protein PspC (stress-responsive transcriptional regulator)